jgi:hypothetical protein
LFCPSTGLVACFLVPSMPFVAVLLFSDVLELLELNLTSGPLMADMPDVSKSAVGDGGWCSWMHRKQNLLGKCSTQQRY